jgi:glycogen debranching enzyme
VIEAESLILFQPLILGRRLPDEVSRALVAGLKQPGRFLTDYGWASESVASPYYVADGYWRGALWAAPTLLLVDGLVAVGETEFARDISRRFCQMAAAKGMAENYDARTGDGLRDRSYSWTSSVFLILGHEFGEL